MISRRRFVQQSMLGAGALMAHPLLHAMTYQQSGIEISLAEWSLHRALKAGKIDHLDFPKIARNDFGIGAVEYVNGFFGGRKKNFKEAGKDTKYLAELLKRSTDAGVVNHLLMVDEEGDLAGLDEKKRLKAVDDHRKWLEAAKYLQCRTVRVNLHGSGDPDAKKTATAYLEAIEGTQNGEPIFVEGFKPDSKF